MRRDDIERRMELRDLWLSRLPEKRTESDVLSFYFELFESRPELLELNRDAYKQLKQELREYIVWVS